MNLKRLIPLALLFTVLFAFVPAHAQAKSHRVLFALTSSDEADWKLMLGNIRNLISGLAPNLVEVEVVAYGPGISSVQKGSAVEAEIMSLEVQHVNFVACENSMKIKHISATDLVSGVRSVPAGIVEVVVKQEQGWSYIKSGK